MAFLCIQCGTRTLDIEESEFDPRVCIGCEKKTLPTEEKLTEVGLSSEQRTRFSKLAYDHGPTRAAHRVIADLLHDAMPRDNEWNGEAKRRLFAAHATCRRLAEIFAVPR